VRYVLSNNAPPAIGGPVRVANDITSNRNPILEPMASGGETCDVHAGSKHLRRSRSTWLVCVLLEIMWERLCDILESMPNKAAKTYIAACPVTVVHIVSQASWAVATLSMCNGREMLKQM
jgi:hypothetical protein